MNLKKYSIIFFEVIGIREHFPSNIALGAFFFEDYRPWFYKELDPPLGVMVAYVSNLMVQMGFFLLKRGRSRALCLVLYNHTLWRLPMVSYYRRVLKANMHIKRVLVGHIISYSRKHHRIVDCVAIYMSRAGNWMFVCKRSCCDVINETLNVATHCHCCMLWKHTATCWSST